MKTTLSNLLPVWKACETLGEERVRRMVESLLRHRHQQSSHLHNHHQQHQQTHLHEPKNTTSQHISASTIYYYDDAALQADVTLLAAGLLYRGTGHNDNAAHTRQSPGGAGTGPSSTVATAWKRWLTNRELALEKPILLQFVVPHALQPHAGASGHMGLFDCWCHALQQSTTSSGVQTPGGVYYGGSPTITGGGTTASGTHLAWFPDVVILLAIAYRYREFVNVQLQKEKLRQQQRQQKQQQRQQRRKESAAAADTEGETSAAEEDGEGKEKDEDDEDEEDEDDDEESDFDEDDEAIIEEIIRTMARLAFRIYDSYQKKGIVTRDTLHRFLTDVHGEDSFKEQTTAHLLDDMFDNRYDPQASRKFARGDLHASLSENKFINAVLNTHYKSERLQPTHILLDWMSMWLCAMIPPPEVPPSVTAYLDTMQHRPKPLCDLYQIAESRLFEVKRRFHSLVRAGPSVIEGDPMGNTNADGTTSTTNQSANGSGSEGGSVVPKQAITVKAFLEAVCQPNEEMGSGGFLPPDLARVVFKAGCPADLFTLAVSDDEEDPEKLVWNLPNVVRFGCMAVRQKMNPAHLSKKLMPQSDPPPPPGWELVDNRAASETSLLRFLFHTFQLTVPIDPQYTDSSVLTKKQLANMLHLLVQHMEFRRVADASPTQEDENGKLQVFTPIPMDQVNDETLEDFDACYELGILPPHLDKRRPHTAEGEVRENRTVPLKALVDFALKSATTNGSQTMTFEELCMWDGLGPEGGPRSRFSSLMMDIRLIAAVLFGVPPTLASLEINLIAEIERRHKLRYPQTSVNRRGPRGTVWYIINAEWLRLWVQHVNDVAGTPDDGVDGRTYNKGGVRGLGRIENANLLTSPTLALRSDIQWKHDYEILPPLAWHALQAWYDGGPPIYRSVVRYLEGAAGSRGSSTVSSPSPHASKMRMPTENEIELYPYFVTIYLCDTASGGEARPFQQQYQLSRVSPVGITLVQLCKELDVDPMAARLWVLHEDVNNTSAKALDPSQDDTTVKDYILSRDRNIVEQRKARGDGTNTQGQKRVGEITLLLELKDPESGAWPRGEDGRAWAALRARSANKRPKSDLGDGIVGLYNMGNTCYFNAPIQCLSATPIFREYFTSKAYINDINTNNPLGHQGQLAQVLAVLINSLWKPFNNNVSPPQKRVTAPGSYVMVNAQSLTPKTFKESLGKFNDIFSGNEQQDAQEFLTFLLAGLSEDLNRIYEKPYIEAPDSDGRPDRELADIWWENHLKRELSLIVSLFNGQYKNLLTCRTCKYESARFEPFSTLTVPLPEDDTLSVSLILYPSRPAIDIMRYCVRVSGSGKLEDVLFELAKVMLMDERASSTSEEGTGDGDDTKQGETETSQIAEDDIKKKAEDFAIVDMREGYIFKIAPISWQLHDLQNKDTGDLPTLHVYELDPLPEEASAGGEGDADGDQDGDKEVFKKPRSGYLAISQRRSDVTSRDYLHPLSHKVFGTPLLLRIPGIENYTGNELYDLVARRLKPLVPKGALRFVSSDPALSQQDNDEKTDETDETPTPQRSSEMTHTQTDMEDVAAGPLPRFGFRLRVTSRDGRRCLICPWYNCCIGCYVNDDDTTANVMDGDSLVVDWHFAVDVATSGFGLRAGLLDPIASRPAPIRVPRFTGVTIKNHHSCGTDGKNATASSNSGVITLEQCLDAFAKEEKIPEAYCSKCKDFRVQMTRMTLWRLPPILVIHLKRFQFTATMRRKLRDLVVFPLEGLDLSRIMAPEGGCSEGLGRVAEDVAATAQSTKSQFGELPASPAKSNIGELSWKTKESTATASATTTDDSSTVPEEAASKDSRQPPEDDTDSASTSTAGADKPSDPSNMLYDLYAVIHHQGALSGGHYVASVKSELDGQWRLFNDAQIFEIHARDVIDASAYILFYIRRDVSKAKMSDYWDLRQAASMSAEEMDNLMNGKSDRCVVS